MLCDVSIASCSSAGVKGLLYFSELMDLKLSFCFSVLFLKVTKCGLELLMEEFAENVSANVLDPLNAIAYLHLRGNEGLVECQDVNVGFDFFFSFSNSHSFYVCDPLFFSRAADISSIANANS